MQCQAQSIGANLNCDFNHLRVGDFDHYPRFWQRSGQRISVRLFVYNATGGLVFWFGQWFPATPWTPNSRIGSQAIGLWICPMRFCKCRSICALRWCFAFSSSALCCRWFFSFNNSAVCCSFLCFRTVTACGGGCYFDFFALTLAQLVATGYGRILSGSCGWTPALAPKFFFLYPWDLSIPLFDLFI